MRDPLRLFAEATGEHLLAVDGDRLGLQAREPSQSSAGGIAVIGLQGPLTPRGLSFFGRTVAPGMDAFRAAGDRAAADPGVGAIVLDVNTPGGTWTGTPETAASVARWAAAKPVVAVVEGLMASAGLLIGSQATEVVVSPSGEIGSLGVLSLHMDMSRALDAEGVTPTLIRSRPSKADRNPFEPLTDEARAAIKDSVMAADEEFIKAVAKGRNLTVAQVRKLADEGGLGRVVDAKAALSMGMADRIATMAEVLNGMIRPRAPRARRTGFAFA